MTEPRRHIAGQVAFLTRRCSERRYFLRPDDFIRQVFDFEVGKAAVRHGQHLYAAVAMSNHVHFAVGDTTGDRSYFMKDVMGEVAKVRNRDLNRTGHFWESGQFGDTVLMDCNAIERKLLYIWLNPVKAGLVERVQNWPGFKILPKHWGETIRIEKPGRFYGRENPDVVEFTPQPPPGYEDMTLQEVKEHFQRLLELAQNEIVSVRKEVNEQIKGPDRVRRVDPMDSPSTPEPRQREGCPRFATKDRELMAEARENYRAFLEDYESVRQRWLKGKKNVTFPCGTVQLRRFAPVSCEPTPEDEPALFATAG